MSHRSLVDALRRPHPIDGSMRDPEKALVTEAPHEDVQRRDLGEIVRWLARAAARTWLSEQPTPAEPSGQTGRSGPCAKPPLPSKRERGRRE